MMILGAPVCRKVGLAHGRRSEAEREKSGLVYGPSGKTPGLMVVRAPKGNESGGIRGGRLDRPREQRPPEQQGLRARPRNVALYNRPAGIVWDESGERQRLPRQPLPHVDPALPLSLREP
jgi:hypothetical protein